MLEKSVAPAELVRFVQVVQVGQSVQAAVSFDNHFIDKG